MSHSMPNRPAKILLAEPDPESLDVLVAALTRRFNPQITCVSDLVGCLDADTVEPHDLILAEWRPREADEIDWLSPLAALNPRPILLLSEPVTREDVIEAFRGGARDLFIKPIQVSELLDAVDRWLQKSVIVRRQAVKYRRMRDLVRRVIRERRELQRRTDLVCRDLVDAHRRLVHKVLTPNAG